MDSAFNQNESEFSILIFSVSFKMLSDIDGLLDHVEEVLGDLGSETILLQNSKDFAASDPFNLGNAVVISKNDTNLRRRGSLFSHFYNLFNEIIGGDLDPARGSLSEGKTSSGNTLALGVHSTHICVLSLNLIINILPTI